MARSWSCVGLVVILLAGLATASPVSGGGGVTLPDRPTGLAVTTQAGTLDVGVDWDDVDGASSYLVRWRLAGEGNPLNEGEGVELSEATITVEGHGRWVVRVEACNDAGCGLGAAKHFTTRPAPEPEPTPEPESEPESEPEPEPENRAPVVNADAAGYEKFIGTHNAPPGVIVFKMFAGLFSDPDGDQLTYTASIPDDRAAVVENLRIRESGSLLFFQYESEDRWASVTPVVPNPVSTEVTLTATDPDGLSASLTGTFRGVWASQPVLRYVDAFIITSESEDSPEPGEATPPPPQGDTSSDSADVILVFDQDLQTSPAPAAGQFAVKVFNLDDSAAGTVAVETVEVKDSRVVLELESVPARGQYFTLDYTPDDDRPLKQVAPGGAHAPGFTNEYVTMRFTTSEPPTDRAKVTAAATTATTLVSNTGQTSGGNIELSRFDQAQSFTTGSSPRGYKLTAVDLSLTVGTGGAPGDVPPTFSVSICSESSGRPSTPCLGTLASPDSLASGTNRFTASSDGIDLAAETTYFVVADVTAQNQISTHWKGRTQGTSTAAARWAGASRPTVRWEGPRFFRRFGRLDQPLAECDNPPHPPDGHLRLRPRGTGRAGHQPRCGQPWKPGPEGPRCGPVVPHRVQRGGLHADLGENVVRHVRGWDGVPVAHRQDLQLHVHYPPGHLFWHPDQPGFVQHRRRQVHRIHRARRHRPRRRHHLLRVGGLHRRIRFQETALPRHQLRRRNLQRRLAHREQRG